MPIYDMYCPNCKKGNEYFVQANTSENPNCFGCGGKLERTHTQLFNVKTGNKSLGGFK